MVANLTIVPKPLLLVADGLLPLGNALPGWDVSSPALALKGIESISGRSVDVWLPNDSKGFAKAKALVKALMAMSPQRVRLIRPTDEKFNAEWGPLDALKAGWSITDLAELLEASATVIKANGAAEPAHPPAIQIPEGDAPVPLIPGTDLANAARFTKRHGDNFRFTTERGWMVWSGSRWQVDDKQIAICKLAMESAESLLGELKDIPAGDRDKAYSVAKAAAQKRAIEAAVWMARSHNPERIAAFDQRAMLLNCSNGMVDLETGKLLQHDRGAYCSLLTGCEYHEDAPAPRWEQFISEVCMANADLIAYVQRMCGYLLSADISEQCLFFLFGSGANGKTVLVETLTRVMGEYALGAETDMLMIRKHAGIPNDVARLRGLRACFLNETNKGQRFDEAKLKNLTGGDTLTARFLREEFFDFKPTHKLVLRGNHKPTVNGTDEAIWRRLRLIPFDLRLTPEQKDLHLERTLSKELPGILAWMVRGCLAWRKHGLGVPAVVAEAVGEYREESDTLGRFIEDCCNARNNLQVKTSDLYKAYRTFCEECGERYLSARDFPSELEQRGFKRLKSNGIRFTLALELKTALSVDPRYSEPGEPF